MVQVRGKDRINVECVGTCSYTSDPGDARITISEKNAVTDRVERFFGFFFFTFLQSRVIQAVWRCPYWQGTKDEYKEGEEEIGSSEAKRINDQGTNEWAKC